MKIKQQVSLTLFILFIAASTHAQWKDVTSGFLYNQQAHFASENVVFVVGSSGLPQPEINGYIARSTNGGNHFSVIRTVPDGEYSAVHFFNEQVGLVAGDHQAEGVVLRTTDGGNNWQTLPVDAYVPDFQNFYFFNDNLGFLCGGFAQGFLFKTIDGGQSWEKVPGVWPDGLRDIHFIDDQRGYVASIGGDIYQTFDQGQSWSLMLNLPEDRNIDAIRFLNPSIGFISYQNRGLYRTRNGGLTWTKLNVSATNTPVLGNLYFVNDVLGFYSIVDDDKSALYVSEDAGQSWEEIITQSDLDFFDFITFSPGHTKALAGGWSDLKQHENATSFIAPLLPYALISGSTEYCSSQPPVNIRIDFGGTPPFSAVLKSSFPDEVLSNIQTTPYYHPVSPASSVGYFLREVKDASGISHDGIGNAYITVNPIASAVLSGKDTVCAGESAQLQVVFTGCPPFSITLSNGTQSYTENNITEKIHTLQVPLMKDSVTSVEVSIVSMTDGAGQTSTNVSGEAELFSHESTVFIGGYSEDEICVQEGGEIFLSFKGLPPYCVKYRSGSNHYEKCNILNRLDTLIVPATTEPYLITEVSNSCGKGRVLNNVQVQFELKEFTANPENLIATLDPEQRTVHLSWSDMSDNESHFYIYRKTSEDAFYKKIYSVFSNIESYIDYTAHEGDTNRYYINANNFMDVCPANSDTIEVYFTKHFEPVTFPVDYSPESQATTWLDVNNDDLPDLFITYVGILLNKGGGMFSPPDTAAPFYDEMSRTDIFCAADYDNDGDVDVYCYPHNASESHRGIYKNNGDNTFSKVEIPAPPSGGTHPTSGNWGDADGDLDLDLIVSGKPVNYYRNEGNDVFTLVPDIGIAPQQNAYDNSFIDYDDDGDLDIMFMRLPQADKGEVYLYQNNGIGYFTEIDDNEAYYSSLIHSHSWLDINHDRFLDLVMCWDEYEEEGCSTYLNLGTGKFQRVITTGFTQHASGSSNSSSTVSDFNNDGRMDIIATGSRAPNPIYFGMQGNDYTHTLTTHFSRSAAAGGGVATADFNRDGYMDIGIKSSASPDGDGFYLGYQNTKKYPGNWVEIKCVGTTSNTSAIGAKLFLKSKINNEDIWQVRHILTSSGRAAQSDLVQHFGLGDAAQIDSLIIEWPSGNTTYHNLITINSFHIIREDGSIDPVQAPELLQAENYSYSRVDLSWSDVSNNEYNFILERSFEQNQGFIILDTLPANTTSFIDSTVFQNTDYYYRIYNYNSFGPSAYSNTAHTKTFLECSVLAEIFSEDTLQIKTGEYVWLTTTPGSGYLYEWSLDGEIIPLSNDSLLTSRGGTYQVIIETPEHCVDTSNEVVIILQRSLFYNGNSEIVTSSGASKSASWMDINRDGFEDVFITNEGSNTVLLNRGDGTFDQVLNHDLATKGEQYSAAWADYNNDSYPDVFVTNKSGYSKLYRNNHDGSFTGIIVDPDHKNLVVTSWGDINNDGFVDLFAGSETNGWVYLNVGGQSFLRLDVQGLADEVHDNRGATWFDYDNDDFVDLILSDNAGGVGNEVYRNKGNMTFELIDADGIGKLKKSHSTNIIDFDNDGDLDIFCGGFAGTAGANMYRNDGNGIFTALSGNLLTDYETLSTGSNWADYDNDGLVDVFLGGSDQLLFRNTGNTSFDLMYSEIDFPETSGQRDRGIAWGDIQNDGFPDLMVARDKLAVDRKLPNLVFENTPNGNNWLIVEPIGVMSNYMSIGARVTVKAAIRGENVTQTRYIASPSGGTFGGSNSVAATFGLGTTTTADSVIVEWPCGGKAYLTNVTSNQKITMLQPPMAVMASSFIQVCLGTQVDSITILKDTFHLSGYDSVHITHIIPVEFIRQYTYHDIVEGSSYNGITLYADTVFTDTITTSLGCDSIHYNVINVEEITSIDDPFDELLDVQLHPNPADDKINISFEFVSSLEGNIELLDAFGRVHEVKEFKAVSVQTKFTLDMLSPGMYYILISTTEGSALRRFIKM